IAEIVSQRVKLEANRVGGEGTAGKPRPLDRALAFSDPLLTRPTFVGLRAMDESWANRFFGRKADVRELIEKFKKHRLIAIVADSGAGKSSLALAPSGSTISARVML